MHVLVFPRCRLHTLSGRPALMGPSLIKRRNKIKIEFWIFRKTLKLLAQFRWTFLKVSLLLTVPLLRNPWWLSLSLWVGLECSLVFQALHKLSLQFCLPLLWISVIYSSPACYLTDPLGHQTLGLFLFSPFIRMHFLQPKRMETRMCFYFCIQFCILAMQLFPTVSLLLHLGKYVNMQTWTQPFCNWPLLVTFAYLCLSFPWQTGPQASSRVQLSSTQLSVSFNYECRQQALAILAEPVMWP